MKKYKIAKDNEIVDIDSSEYLAICLDELLDAGIDEGAHWMIFREADLTEFLTAIDDDEFMDECLEHFKPYLKESLSLVIKEILREERK